MSIQKIHHIRERERERERGREEESERGLNGNRYTTLYVELMIFLLFLFCPVIIKLCAHFLSDLVLYYYKYTRVPLDPL